ncbi:hypothetical protein F5Y17DRAFT_448436 [Xylariaceae sp. FL0594]|nr:hypothetical protein F5Y17DRAFT_448436 [Xylariaceae sp. FL0594]
MSSSHHILTDDHVAELLVKEANGCSLKYSAMGMDAFKSDKRPANQPKPNTRFLNNIIRDTNSHNRALLAKENAESQARLRDLELAERQKREEERRRERRAKPDAKDTRKRMLGDIAAILGRPSKRRRAEDDDKEEEGDVDRSRSKRVAGREGPAREDKPRSRNARDQEGEDDERDNYRTKKRSHGDEDYSKTRDDSDRRSHRHEKERERHRDRDRDRSRERDRERDRDHRRNRDRTRSRSGSRDREREERHRRRRERSSRDKDDSRSARHRDSEKAEKTSTRREAERREKESDSDSDSDPLDDIIGPAPASKSTVRRRGRGAISAMSGIDTRFAADYDPKVDVSPDPEEAAGDDWDNAVETFRDRMKWKQQGAERLRSAGFTEEQIRKWEKGDEKDETDVKWNEAGGVREWDRGKVVSPDGAVTPQPEYGRLKGT